MQNMMVLSGATKLLSIPYF